ncbi:RIB43A-like with coiled-coils protein 2 [Varanus komodoensis]|nr:RIB43A-like with coiled-coils protein 2 [Varanus komodoensis]
MEAEKNFFFTAFTATASARYAGFLSRCLIITYWYFVTQSLRHRSAAATHILGDGTTAEGFKSHRLEEEERQRNLEWDRKRVQEARAALLYERHQQRQNRELRRALDNMNAQLSQEQKARQTYLEEEVYANFPSGQYYTQFNTTSR